MLSCCRGGAIPFLFFAACQRFVGVEWVKGRLFALALIAGPVGRCVRTQHRAEMQSFGVQNVLLTVGRLRLAMPEAHSVSVAG